MGMVLSCWATGQEMAVLSRRYFLLDCDEVRLIKNKVRATRSYAWLRLKKRREKLLWKCWNGRSFTEAVRCEIDDLLVNHWLELKNHRGKDNFHSITKN